VGYGSLVTWVMGQFTEGSDGSWVTKMTHCQLCPRLPCAADCVLTRSALSTHYPHLSRGQKNWTSRALS